ncbi:hypothetical protein GCM10027416_15920 [Okibacterium endophyticum]
MNRSQRRFRSLRRRRHPLNLTLDFHTADNARSLERILNAWDAAGYAPDRAMQQDIRYSGSLPVEMMSIRDATSIDGLIHMQITSRCTVAGSRRPAASTPCVVKSHENALNATHRNERR